jgi:hypothetical protein
MKNAKRICWAALIAALCVAGISRPVSADDDPPGRVGRLNLVQGSVSFQPAGGGDSDWVAADLNRPMTTGDRLWADQDGRAELHVGSTAIRLDHNTGISFLNLADNGVQLQASAGSLIVRLRRLDPTDSFEVDAPNLAFSLLRPGDYRVDVDPDQNVTTVAVLQGEGEVTGGGRAYRIIADQRATFTGTDTLQYQLDDFHSVPQGDFDTWAAGRDAQQDHVDSDRYVSPEVTGVEDLDRYGAWRTVPDYGPMWVPAGVAVGWAPYRFGHWVWVTPWGWTWVEDEPWGFAPFHYGRWAFAGGVWGWVPGPIAARPVYAPALVAWVGGAPGFEFSVSFGAGGGIGWFPLGPREVFVPSYRVSDAYVTRVNVTNTVVERTTVINEYHNTNVRNVTYVNQRVGGGVTVVSHDTFVNARPVGRNAVSVPDRELAAAPVSRNVTAAPVHSSLVGEGRPAAARPPAAVLNRVAIAKRTPPPLPPKLEEQNVQPQPAPGGRPPAQFGGRGSNQQGQAGGNATIGSGQPPAPVAGRDGNQQGQVGGNANVDNGRPPGQFGGRGENQQGQPGGNATIGSGQPPAPVAGRGGNQQGQVGGNANVDNGRPPGQFGGRGGNQQVQGGAPPNVPAPNPRVIPAQPVRPPTPVERQNDNAKQQGWQQQHQQIHQNDAPASKSGKQPPQRNRSDR